MAVFTAAIAGSEYQSSLMAVDSYHSRIQEIFNALSENQSLGEYPPSTRTPILAAYADALVEFAENVADMESKDPTPLSMSQRWTALESAQSRLTQLTNMLSSGGGSAGPSKAQIYYQRGNVEMLRWGLARIPSASPAVKKGESVLLKNAGVYYRGAAGLAKQDGNAELELDAQIRADVVRAIEGSQHGGLTFSTKVEGDVHAKVDEMVEEGLIGNDLRQAFP